MPSHAWIKEYTGAITVCDSEGIILEMNDKAILNFSKRGGEKLIGKNLFDCHPEPARTKLREMMESRRENVYTTEKNGVKSLIRQGPWFSEGMYRGFIEISFEIPAAMPHFIRD